MLIMGIYYYISVFTVYFNFFKIMIVIIAQIFCLVELLIFLFSSSQSQFGAVTPIFLPRTEAPSGLQSMGLQKSGTGLSY